MSHIEKQEILEAEIQLGIEARQWGQKKKTGWRLEADRARTPGLCCAQAIRSP